MKPGTSNKEFSIDLKEIYFNAKPQQRELKIYASKELIKAFYDEMKKEAERLNNSPP